MAPVPGIGQPVKQHVFGAQLEDVEVRGLQQLLALRARRHANGLDALDTKGFDEGFGHGGLWPCRKSGAKLSPGFGVWCRLKATTAALSLFAPDGPNNFKTNWPPALIQKAP
jgi:hypothetical protein